MHGVNNLWDHRVELLVYIYAYFFIWRQVQSQDIFRVLQREVGTFF